MIFLYKPETGEIRQIMDFATSDRIEAMRADGYGVLELSSDPMQNYIDVTDPENPVLRKRPVLEQVPSATEVAILDKIVIPAVPACRLDVVGPMSGTIDHPGGDLTLQFALPGSYEIRCDPYPYRYAQWTIAVHSTAAAAQAAQAAKQDIMA